MSLPTTGRPTWIEVSLGAIVHNFRVAQRKVGGATQVWPVVKADGYGLGAVPIALALQKAGAHGFCVAMGEEAIPLQEAGVTTPVVLLSSAAPGMEGRLASSQWQPFVYTLEDARRLASYADQNQPVSIHVKLDTGMGRLGVSPAELPTLLAQLKEMPGLRVVGIASHLACADDPSSPVTAQQVGRLEATLRAAGESAANLSISLANSGGLLAHPATHYHWVRPGIMLYGANPFHPLGAASDWGLRPVVAWRSRIIQVGQVAAGTPLGYGHTYVTTAASRIAQVAVGYADGYSRRLGGGGHVLIGGTRAPVVGRVCMDLIAVDVSLLPKAEVGTQVTLLGRDGQGEITVEEMATWVDTLPYEIYCRLGQRMPKYYFTD